MWQPLLPKIRQNDFKAIARCISIIENEAGDYQELLRALPASGTPVIGITGPPGAGKSTLVNAMVDLLQKDGKKIAVLCVDPSSPFNLGALLGDRIRMSEWYNSENVFIRSLASRGSLGGLHPHIIEITDLLKASAFDYILIETVGVGQSEIEIAGLADITVVVLVPESGDDIQGMKSGLMEIADVFVVNKADRPGADLFINNLKMMIAPVFNLERSTIPVVATVASRKEGIAELLEKINASQGNKSRRHQLQVEKAWRLIQSKRMKGISKEELARQIEESGDSFNLYRFIDQY